jgi:hypothetical protein
MLVSWGLIVEAVTGAECQAVQTCLLAGELSPRLAVCWSLSTHPSWIFGATQRKEALSQQICKI